MTINISYLIQTLTSLFQWVYDGFIDIYELFTKPIATVLTEFILNSTFGEPLGTILSALTSAVTNSVFGDYSLLSLMLGAGLGFYILWQLVSWVLNIIT